jgi:dephospho-CoA kinase
LRKLAITGGLCSGKSTVSAYLREHGIPVLDADALAHQLLQGAARGAVVKAFGRQILEDGKIAPARLATRVFTHDGAALARLESILHPRVMAAAEAGFRQLEAAGAPLAALEAAQLLEAKLTAGFDYILVVVATKTERVKRFVARGSGTAEQARARMAHQMPDAEKVKQADFVVDNHSRAEARRQLDRILATIGGKP